MRLRAATLGCPLAALLGCQAVAQDETGGTLNVGAFGYRCVAATDRACSDGEIADAFPYAIAVGARFDLGFRPFESRQLAASHITPVTERFVDVDGDAFRARRPGWVAVLARAHADAPVVDFVHIAVTGLWLSVLPGELALRAGASAQVTADPGAAGAFDYTWAVSDSAVLALEPEEGTARARVRALAPGRGSVSVSAGGVTAEATVEVLSPDATVPEPDADAGGDADGG